MCTADAEQRIVIEDVSPLDADNAFAAAYNRALAVDKVHLEAGHTSFEGLVTSFVAIWPTRVHCDQLVFAKAAFQAGVNYGAAPAESRRIPLFATPTATLLRALANRPPPRDAKAGKTSTAAVSESDMLSERVVQLAQLSHGHAPGSVRPGAGQPSAAELAAMPLLHEALSEVDASVLESANVKGAWPLICLHSSCVLSLSLSLPLVLSI